MRRPAWISTIKPAFFDSRRLHSVIILFWGTFPLLFGGAGCATVESFFQTIHIAAGAETSDVRFYTHKSDPVASLRNSLNKQEDFTENGNQYHSESRNLIGGFYTVSSPPAAFPGSKKFRLLQVFSYSLTLKNPRVFRGVLFNYPDDGRIATSPEQALINEIFPLPGLLRRQMEYTFEEFQAYATIYFPYINTGTFYLGIGYNRGGARYSLDLHEKNVRITNVKSKWRPLSSFSFTWGYNLGRHFESGSALADTHIFLEVDSEQVDRYPLQANLRRSNSLYADSLFVESNHVRIGIRKELNLFTNSLFD